MTSNVHYQALSMVYLCFLTTERLSLRTDCNGCWLSLRTTTNRLSLRTDCNGCCVMLFLVVAHVALRLAHVLSCLQHMLRYNACCLQRMLCFVFNVAFRCFYFYFVYVQQLSQWRSCTVSGPGALCLFIGRHFSKG